MTTASPTGPGRPPRRVLLTGANRGLGLELARRHIDGGDEVYATGRPGRTDQVARLGPAGVLEMDLGDETSIVAAVARLADRVDGLDLLVNCAGIDARAAGAAADARGPFELTADQFDTVLRVNVTGPMVLTREAVDLLRRGRDPLVLNVSSQLGSMEVGASAGRDTAYNVSKAALNMLTLKSAAALRADGIAVVAVHPGWVSTDMGGSAAQLTPEESAAAIHRTLGALGPADSGRFIRWDGTDHPW